jgi:hypothetical protein
MVGAFRQTRKNPGGGRFPLITIYATGMEGFTAKAQRPQRSAELCFWVKK